MIAVVGPKAFPRQPAQSEASAPLQAPPEAVGDNAERQKDAIRKKASVVNIAATPPAIAMPR